MWLARTSIFLFLILPMMSFAAHKISLNLVDIEIRDLLKMIAKGADKNVIISDKIKGKVSFDLKNIAWEKAFDVVLKSKGLFKYNANDVIIVLTNDEIGGDKKSCLKQKVLNLKHVSAENTAKLLQASGMLSKYGKLGTNASNNTLVVSDIDSNIDAIKDVVKKIDRKAPQVSIEARIVSADETFLRELGVEFGEKGRSKVFNQGQFNFSVIKMKGSDWLDIQLSILENKDSF